MSAKSSQVVSDRKNMGYQRNLLILSHPLSTVHTSCDIASEILVSPMSCRVENHLIIFVVNDLGPGQVPHVLQDPRRGCAGQGHRVVKGQGSGQTDAKFVGFSFVGWKKFKEIFPAL